MRNATIGEIRQAIGILQMRDQFAMAALTAIVSNHMSGMERPKWDSSLAYEYADAMMEARDAKR